MYADEGVIKIKHDVLTTVAELEFAGTAEQEKEYLPEKLSTEQQARLRC